MFNTSTLITLGLTALLCGIIMFYCKRKLAEYEQKLNVMSDLISNIITQFNQIPPSVYDNSSFVPPGFSGGEAPANIAMNIVPPVEEDSSDDNEENDNEENDIEEIDNEETGNEDKRIIVNLTNSFEADTNTISLNQEPLEEKSWDSEESDDEFNSNKIFIKENDLNVVLESENLNTETATAKVIAEEMVTKIVDEVSDTDSVKVIDTNTPPVDVDYSKLQVAMLKKWLSESSLKVFLQMKKQELIDVLMNKSQ